MDNLELNENVDFSITLEDLATLDNILKQYGTPNKSLNVTKLHGLITALLSNSQECEPEDLLAGIFPGNTDIAEETLDVFMQILFRMIVSVDDDLANENVDFVFWSGKENISFELASEALITEWAHGYCLGLQLDPIWWDSQETLFLILPFFALTGILSDAEAYREATAELMSKKQEFLDNLPDMILENYFYWPRGDHGIEDDDDDANDEVPHDHHENGCCGHDHHDHDHAFIKMDPYRRDFSKVGRNDVCPCGSGKKFKKCCAESIH